MRIRQIRGGFAVAVNNEEEVLLQLIEEAGQFPRSQLDERGRVLARRLLSKGVINHQRIGGATVYSLNDLEDIWRD